MTCAHLQLSVFTWFYFLRAMAPYFWSVIFWWMFNLMSQKAQYSGQTYVVLIDTSNMNFSVLISMVCDGTCECISQTLESSAHLPQIQMLVLISVAAVAFLFSHAPIVVSFATISILHIQLSHLEWQQASLALMPVACIQQWLWKLYPLKVVRVGVMLMMEQPSLLHTWFWHIVEAV